MSDEEKYAVQGRAHADLRNAKSIIATVTTALTKYCDRLGDAENVLRRFISNPLDGNEPTPEGIKKELRNCSPVAVEAQIDELAHASKRARDLQAQIENF